MLMAARPLPGLAADPAIVAGVHLDLEAVSVLAVLTAKE
jgi:hypothetical protein